MLLFVCHNAACSFDEEKADERHPVGREVDRSIQDRIDSREDNEGHCYAG